MWVIDYVFHISFVISTGFKYVDNELRIPNELKPIPFVLSLGGEKAFFEGKENFILFFPTPGRTPGLAGGCVVGSGPAPKRRHMLQREFSVMVQTHRLWDSKSSGFQSHICL